MLKSLAIAALLLPLSLPSRALAISHGVRVTLDQCTALITKDIGGQRWSIGRSLCSNPVIVTGIVSSLQNPDAEPTFFQCAFLAFNFDGVNDALDCFIAPACRLGNCPPWQSIGTVIVSDDFLNNFVN